MATVLDERPAADVPQSPRVPQRSAAPLSRWRLAARLARRDVRRRPGRTLLVTLLVAVPVLGMTLASVLAHTSNDPWAEDFALSHGRADMVGTVYGQTGPFGEETTSPTDAELGAALPFGSRWETSSVVYSAVRTAEDTRFVQVTDREISSPLLTGAFSIRDGRAPMGPGEVALDQETADEFGVEVGDTLTLVEPAGSWTVSGIVRQESYWSQSLVVFGEFDWDRVSPGSLGGIIYVDLPAGTTVEQTAASLTALQGYGHFEARDVTPEWMLYGDSGDRVSTSAMAWGWVAGALALCVVGIIIAAAFATSARRQLVTLGQLSANGADQKLLRRTMALQGSWSGLFGSLGGVALGLVLLVVFRGVVDQLADKHLGAYEIMPVDLVIIVLTGVAAATIAALVPARSIAKVPVMAALSGRRPLGAVPRRLVPIGLGLFGAGLFLLMLAATATTGNDGGGSGDGDLYAAVAVLGGLGVLFGMCCLSPLAVDTVGKVGARLSGSWRLSARSLARTRTRSAGVVTAIAAAGALALGGATAFASAMAEEPIDTGVPSVPADTVLVAASTWSYDEGPTFGEGSGSTTYDPPGYQVAPIPPSILDQVGAVVDGEVTPRRVALWDPAPYEMTPDGVRVDGLQADESGILMMADPFVLDLIGLSDADRARLDDVGAMNVQSYGPLIGYASGSVGPLGPEPVTVPPPVVIDVAGRSPVTVEVIAPLDPIDSLAGVWGTMVTPERAAELGLEIVEDGIFIVADTDLTTAQIERLQDIQNSVWNGSVFDVPDTDQLAGQTQVTITPNYVEDEVPEDLVNLAIVVAALLFTLSIVGIGLALSAAESRDERDVLVAIGAKPSTMRRVAGQKAVLMSLAGTLLAVPTGLLPVVTVVRAVREYPGQYPLAMPWGMVFVLVVGVPVLAGLVTWLGSAAAQRLRPTHMSTLATD